MGDRANSFHSEKSGMNLSRLASEARPYPHDLSFPAFNSEHVCSFTITHKPHLDHMTGP